MKRSCVCFCRRFARRALALSLCAGLALGLFSSCQKRESQAPEIDTAIIQISPSAETEGVIPPDASFNVSFAEKTQLSAGQVQALFRFAPEAAFTAEKQKGGFVLKPESPLPQNTVINLQAVDGKGTVLRSWAYQTQAQLRVRSTTPGDLAEYVPVDTGIEMTLTSALVSQEDFGQHFSLTVEGEATPVEGSVLQVGERLAFVPSSPLAEGTVYNALLEGDLTTQDGMALGEDYTFSFRTADVGDGKGAGDYLMNASPIAETFVTGDAPLIAINCDGEFIDRSVSVSIYRYRAPEDYRAALESLAKERDSSRFPSYVRPQVDVSALDSLGTFDAQITSSGGDYWGTKYIILPGDFEAGWYYLQVKMISPVSGRELSLEKFLQLSEISLYHMQADGDALFWVNHAGTGEPVNGAQLNISGAVSAEGKTGADGTLRLPAADREESSEGILEIVSGEERFVDLYSAQAAGQLSAPERYVSYLYTDRPIYMASDTVRAFGVVRPRGEAFSQPESLRLTLGSYYDEQELYSVPVTLSPNGSFTAEISFDRLGGRNLLYTAVNLVCGEGDQTEQLVSTGVTIGDYEKPTYVPSVTFDKPVYEAGDMAQATFGAAFFDNTPAAGFSAQLDLYGGEPLSFTLTTGADGTATQVFPLPEEMSGRAPGEASTWYPQYLSFYACNAMGENVNFNLYSGIPVFYRDLAIRTELDGTGADRRLTVLTNEIDLSGISSSADLDDEENYIGAPADLPLTVEVHRTYYARIPSGSYYDFIHKRNVTTYDYDYRDELVDSYEVQTSGGSCVLTDLPQREKEKSYYLRLLARDNRGRLVETKAYLGSMDFYYNRSIHRYAFYREDAANDDHTQRVTFTEESGMRFGLQDNGELVSEGRLLWAVAQKGISSSAVESSPGFELSFQEALVPNFVLAGAYFDGRYVYEVAHNYLSFNPENRELDIQVAADREKYAPGDTARLDITVTEKRDGSPAANAAVSLSLVDEAVFAIENRQAYPLQELYRGVYAPNISTYVSYRQYDFLGDGAAEKGGGGGDEGIRTDFKDTAAFLLLTTDASGRVTAEIPLPDNITSWRATVQAVSENLHAGDSREQVIATAPFFINEVLSSRFLEGDEAMLTLRCAGGAISSDTQVDYTLTVKGPGIEKTETASGRAADYTALPLGKLQKGSYTVTMAAESGEYSDGIEKTVQVLQSGVQTQLSRTFALSEGIDIDPQRFPVQIGFYNAEYAVWADVLSHIWSAWGGRTDERMAVRYAQEKLCALSGEQPPEGLDDFSDVMDSYGHISLLPYDSSSVSLSARVHLAAPEYLPNGQQTNVFYNILGYELSEASETAWAYLGLAAHREPVLTRLQQLMGAPADFTEKDRLVLLAALAALGDMETAREYYETLVLPKLQDAQSADGEKVCFYGRSADIEENLEWTAAASLTASILRTPEADGLIRYLMKNRSARELYYLEEMVYLRYNEPQGKTQAGVSYKKDGKTVTLDLKKTGMQFVSFVAEDFEQAQIKEKSGSVSAQVYYTGGLQEALGQENRSITLEKTVAPREGTELKTGDIVRITIRPQMDSRLNPYGMTVDDYVPSGLRFLSMGTPESDGKAQDRWMLIRQEGQKLTFGYYFYDYREAQDQPAPGEETYEAPSELVYYARCAVPGSYVVDSAYASVQCSSAWGASERSSVTVDE